MSDPESRSPTGEAQGETAVTSRVVSEETAERRIPVRATVHLSGLPLGRTAWVDPTDPYVRELLEQTHLVPYSGYDETDEG